ncbi:LOW QUALITY PROTEIN: hypothetical protein SETIT_3G369500v2 [Setaria italica]|uniref:Uncharacterized protein n=1 Tax=Setaria italica TaxID=4555 RepID=A0A368QMZ4_SETIT|nr:LOW QUALITY PROTEIN: hypothetical protein SETIT_3G369500v2 [Setaria italica]
MEAAAMALPFTMERQVRTTAGEQERQGRGSGGRRRDGPPRPTSRNSREGVVAAGGCEDSPSSPSTAPLLASEHERKEGAVASDGRGDGPLFSFSGAPPWRGRRPRLPQRARAGTGPAGWYGTSPKRCSKAWKDPAAGPERMRMRCGGELLPLTAGGARRRRRATRTPPRCWRRHHPRARERPQATVGGGGVAFLRDSRGTPTV